MSDDQVDERRIEYLPLEALRPARSNPKLHDGKRIVRSVGRFGYVEPITLDERTGRLVAGHGRVEALTEMHAQGDSAPSGIKVDDDGRWLVPVTRGWASRSDAEADAYLVASNQLVTAGGWDDAALADLLSGITDPVDLGFPDVELEGLLSRVGATDFLSEFTQPVPDAVPAAESSDAEGNVTIRTGRKGDNAHVTVIMSFAERDEVIATLKRCKQLFGLQTTADALLHVARAWAAANPAED